MKPIVVFLVLGGVGVGFGIGIVCGKRLQRTPAPVAQDAQVVALATAPGKSEATEAATASGAGGPVPVVVSGARSPKVKELLKGFDRRRPVESQLAVLQKIMAASAADLAAMAREMAGQWRFDPGWSQTKMAVLQRWVELAPEEAIAWARNPRNKGADEHQASEVFGMLAHIDPSRAMAEAQRLPNPMLKNRAVQSVIGSISQNDPEQALRLCQELPANHRGNLHYIVFSNWADRNPGGAGATLLALKDRNEMGMATYALMNRWASVDSSGALAWAKGVADSSVRQNALGIYFTSQGQRDPETAISQISAFPKSQQHGFLSKVIGTWVRSDPDAATAWVMARPSPLEQQQLLAVGAGSLGWMGSEQAANLVARLSPGSAREEAMKDLLRDWTWGDADAAVEFSKTLPAQEQSRVRGVIAENLANRDPEKAMAYLKENPIEDAASSVWANLGGSMARTSSPAKALEWANALPDEVSRRKALPAIFSQMVRDDPAGAAKQAAALPDESVRLECLSSVAGGWAGMGMDEALAWAKGLTGKDREAAMGAVLGQGAPHQPILAAEQFDDLMTGVPTGTKPADGLLTAASTIATAYFAENQQAAAQWASTLPQDDARTAAVTSLAQQWAEYDPAGASEWIGTLPDGQARDAAVGRLVGKIAVSDPSSAFAWATTVADDGDRSTLLQTTFNSWRKLDPRAARSAIESADWPNDEKSKWLDKVK